MSLSLDLQKAIFERLSGTLAIPVHDEVPQVRVYPYIGVGDDTVNVWDTDTFNGAECTVTIHTWSQYAGRREVKDLQGKIYEQLHKQKFTVDNHQLVYCLFDNEDSTLDPDGVTRHGVSSYDILLRRI